MLRKAKEKTIIEQILKDQHGRVILSATAGFGVNLAYALYHGAVGIATGSLWFLLLCAYCMILSVVRFSAVLYDRRRAGSIPSFSELFLFRFVGGMLMLLSAILALSVYLSFQYDVAVVHSEIMMITIAAYTFYKMTMAVVNAVKARKQRTLWLIAIRNIGCADAAASLLTLQRSMLVSFEGMNSRDIELMNVLTGAGVCLVTAALGIYMVLGKGKQNGKVKTDRGK